MTLASPLDRPLVSARFAASLLGVSAAELRRTAKHASELYEPFTLVQRKHGRTKRRQIDNPQEPLKGLQHRIKRVLLDPLPLPRFMCGGVRGRSTQMNARPHVRQRWVATLDIANFFGSVTNRQVAGVWRETFGASDEVTWLLTRLTTYQGHIPQGSPASTSLANLVVLPAAVEIDCLCRSSGLRFTIYVDDITVSGCDVAEIHNEIARILGRHGFRLARGKSEVMPQHLRQQVTGHVVNRRLSNGRARLRRARDLVLDAVHGGDLDDRRRALGLVSHICSTAPHQGRWLRAALSRTPRGALAR